MQAITVQVKTKRGDGFKGTLSLLDDKDIIQGSLDIFGTEVECIYSEVLDYFRRNTPSLRVFVPDLPQVFKDKYNPKPSPNGYSYFALQPADARRIKSHLAEVKARANRRNNTRRVA